MKLVKANADDFAQIVPQRNQKLTQLTRSPKHIERLLLGDAYTVMTDDEATVVAIFGTLQQEPGVLSAWSILSEGIGGAGLLFTTRAAIRWREAVLDSGLIRRIEFTVESDYREGVRWAAALGFKSEGLLHKYGPDGKNHILFAYWRD